MDSLENVRPVWAEINLDNLAHNIKEVRRVVNKESLITAVIKADAYGHGSVMAAKIFLENGADRLAVATLSEAIELRNAGIMAEILILGYTPDFQAITAIENNITLTVYNYENAYSISKAAKNINKTAKIHIKIDSGMGRIGLRAEDRSLEDIQKISELSNVFIEGIFTHFAKADEINKEFTNKQFNQFNMIINAIESRGIKIPIKHASNSAAIIDLPEYNLDMVRAGIMLYGLYPSNEVLKDRVNLKPSMILKTKISNVKSVPKGTGISYGHIHITQQDSIIGTIPIGYADGFTRMLINKADVGIKDSRAKVVGRICMDQCMIDVTDITDVKIDDEVIIFGDGRNNSPHIDEVAQKLGTINYEIVCMVSRRVPRVYIKSGEIVKINDYLLK
ncbi:alanine racemase [Brassicibacter mesophilus]|uniref:alanine racemase n=1 Tax=Brassicibacter mesophilus TaxID=745119 RepID=UPI003D2584D6